MAPALAVAYLHWGVVQISLTNALVIVAMVVVFALALVVPFPAPRDDDGVARHAAAPPGDDPVGEEPRAGDGHRVRG